MFSILALREGVVVFFLGILTPKKTSRDTKISEQEWYASARSAKLPEKIASSTFSKARKTLIPTDTKAAPDFLPIPKSFIAFHKDKVRRSYISKFSN